MITPQNLDKWTFDYFEGNLSGEDAAAFEQFLQNNPEFSADAEAWQEAYVAPVVAEYPNIAGLEQKRKIAAGWYGWAAAATIAALLGWGTLALFNTEDFTINGMSNDDNTLVPSYSSENNLNSSAPIIPEYLNEDNLTTSQNSSLVYTNNASNGSSQSTANNSSAFDVSNSFNQTGENQTGVMIADLDLQSDAENDQITENDESSISSSDLVLAQAKSKFEDTEGGKYVNNPEVNPVEFELKHSKSVTLNSFSSNLRKFYRKIERTMGYPLGLKNLRDPEVLMPQNNPLAINPGFTGGMLATRFTMNYRNQFLGNELNSQTLNLSYDTYSRSLRGGLGVSLNVQDYGLGKFTDMNVNLMYSPKFRLSENVVFEPGIRLTIGSISANTDRLNSFETIEMNRGRVLSTGNLDGKTGMQRMFYKDFSVGAVVNTEWFYFGFSANDIGGHFENIYASESGTPVKTDVRYNGVVGFDYESKSKKFGFNSFLSYTNQANFNELWGGFNTRMGWFTVGGAISNKLDYTASVGLKFEKFKLIYRYDNARSIFTNEQLNSHNIGIRFNTKQKSSRIK